MNRGKRPRAQDAYVKLKIQEDEQRMQAWSENMEVNSIKMALSKRAKP